MLTDLALMMRIDPLALIFRLREFVTVEYGPRVVQCIDLQFPTYEWSRTDLQFCM